MCVVAKQFSINALLQNHDRKGVITILRRPTPVRNQKGES
jgi:hypothetical protein